MRLLLDTHALLWWLSGDAHLSEEAEKAIADPTSDVFVSAVSAWEIAWKHTRGKLPGVEALIDAFADEIAAEAFLPLDVAARHMIGAARLRGDHRDPFDRILAAQAEIEGLVLISIDVKMDELGVGRLW